MSSQRVSACLVVHPPKRLPRNPIRLKFWQVFYTLQFWGTSKCPISTNGFQPYRSTGHFVESIVSQSQSFAKHVPKVSQGCPLFAHMFPIFCLPSGYLT